MNKKFLSNTVWIVGGKIVQQLIGFVVSILTASYLGPGNFGIIGYVNSIITLFTAFANLGLGNIIVKEIIEHKGEEGSVIGTASLMQFISSSITYFLVIGTIVALNINDKVMWICAILQSFTLVLAVSDNINYYYQSKLESKVCTIAYLIAYILVQIYKVVLLVLEKSVEWFAFANTLDYLVMFIALMLVYIVKKEPRWHISKDIAKSLIKQSAPFILSGTVAVVYASLDKIMLKELLNETESVGYYNLAFTINNVWPFIISAIVTSFSPLIFEVVHNEGVDSKKYKIRLRQFYFIIFWLEVIIAIAIDIVAPFFIKYAYQNKYNISIIPTMILAWSTCFSYLGVARSVQFVCENKQKYLIWFAIMTVLLNALMNYFLIPQYQVVGASIATLVSEFFVCIIAPLFFKQTRNISITIFEGIIGKDINIKSTFMLFINKLRKKKTVDGIEDTATLQEEKDNKDEE